MRNVVVGGGKRFKWQVRESGQTLVKGRFVGGFFDASVAAGNEQTARRVSVRPTNDISQSGNVTSVAVHEHTYQ